MNLAGYGGVVQEYQTRLFAQPFEAKTGVKVNIGPSSSLALAKLQNASGSPAQWDIVGLTGAEYLEAVEQKLIVPYDYSIIDPTYIPREYRGSHGVKFSLFLFVMAWDKRQIPDDKAPQTLAEFWDTNRYKGKRSLYANVSDGSTLEMALLADGVPLHGLYPLDIRSRAAQPGAARPQQYHLAQHQRGADPTAHLGGRPARQLLQRSRHLGEPIRWPTRLHRRLQRGQRQTPIAWSPARPTKKRPSSISTTC